MRMGEREPVSHPSNDLGFFSSVVSLVAELQLPAAQFQVTEVILITSEAIA